MSDISTSVPVGLPDPFSVVHNRILGYDLTTTVPTTQIVDTSTSTPTPAQLKLPMYFLKTAQTTLTLPSSTGVFRTFNPVNHGDVFNVFLHPRATGAYITVEGNSAYSGVPVTIYANTGPQSILLQCTSATGATFSVKST